MTNYSQNNEQEVILNYFGSFVGRFLDIGAHDGIYFSNTRALVENGWAGIMVEPDPRSLSKLISSLGLYADKVEVIASAVCEFTGFKRLWMDAEAGKEWASGITDFVPAGIVQQSGANLLVPTIAPWQLLMRGPFDFISIDAEGSDYEIVTRLGVPLPCKLICVEPYFDEGRKKMREYLEVICHCKIISENKDNLIASCV